MAAKPFSDRIIPKLSNIPLSEGVNNFMASVTLECENPCRGQVNVVIDGEVHLSTGFEITAGQSASVTMLGEFHYIKRLEQAECLTIEVDCSETVLVTGDSHVQSGSLSGTGESNRYQQKDPVLIGNDPKRCQVGTCKTPAIAGRILCHLHAYPGEKVKSDRRRAIEATLAKRAKVSIEDGR